jgi:ubiquinone biosynthesis accessory factor UbiJ
MLSQPIIATLNHLLARSGWASPRLAKFSGRTAHFTIAPISFACTIQDDGTLHAAAADASADANLVIPPSLLPRLAMQDQAAFGQITTSGDAALVEEILFLGQNLRWDAAEDISRFTGDIAAERIVQFARHGRKAVRDTAANLSQALAEYWTEERPVLAKPAHISDFAQQVGRLHNEVERLEQRIRRLAES